MKTDIPLSKLLCTEPVLKIFRSRYRAIKPHEYEGIRFNPEVVVTFKGDRNEPVGIYQVINAQPVNSYLEMSELEDWEKGVFKVRSRPSTYNVPKWMVEKIEIVLLKGKEIIHISVRR